MRTSPEPVLGLSFSAIAYSHQTPGNRLLLILPIRRYEHNTLPFVPTAPDTPVSGSSVNHGAGCNLWNLSFPSL